MAQAKLKQDLSKTEDALEAPDKLSAHSLAGVLSAERSLLVLAGAAQQEVQAFADGAPGEQLDDLGLGVGLHGGVLNERLRDFVGHALQLGVGQAGESLGLVGEELLGADRLSAVHRVQVVRGEDNVDGREGSLGVGGGDGRGPLLVEDSGGARIVALISALLGVEADTLRLAGQVGATDELDTGDVALVGGVLEVLANASRDAAQVALVGGVDDSTATLLGVVLLLQGKGPLLETEVGNLLLSTGEKADVLGSGSIAGSRDGLPHLRGSLLLVLEEVQGVAAEARPLKTDEVTLASHVDTLQHTLAPCLDLGLCLLGGGLCATKHLESVLDDDAIVAKHGAGIGEVADNLLGVLTSAELGVEGALEQLGDDGVALDAHEPRLGVEEALQDREAHAEQDGRRRHGSDHVRAHDGRGGQTGKDRLCRGCLAVCLCLEEVLGRDGRGQRDVAARALVNVAGSHCEGPVGGSACEREARQALECLDSVHVVVVVVMDVWLSELGRRMVVLIGTGTVADQVEEKATRSATKMIRPMETSNWRRVT
jgi:hypothetical protein